MVMNMMDDIKSHVKDYEDEEEIASYLSKILKKEAFDQKGLIYGMGHAVDVYKRQRLGLSQKNLFVVPNHLTEQWGAEFLQLYPCLLYTSRCV